jgi:hypothetical protein
MIEILPESDGAVLGIRAVGNITQEDYDKVFNPRVESILNEYGAIKILCMLDKGLPKFKAGQPWDQDGFKLKDKRVLPKIAVVGDSLMVRLSAKAIAMSTGSDLKTFSTSKMKQAWDWVRA